MTETRPDAMTETWPDPFTLADAQALRRAVEVAQRARLHASPNPWVGAVVVSDGHVVGEGCTQPPGQSHAEVIALQAAGERARGATIAVTLEPCSHHGRTPPCVDALIAAGVRRVVVGVADPDVKVAGRGVAALRAAGIEVVEATAGSAERSLVEDQLEPYLHHRRTGRPFVVLKLAMTLDGRIAAPDGSSTWITGEVARRDVHRLRAESDAILVGAGTVRADDPALTVRLVEGPDPDRYVLGSIPSSARIQPAVSVSGPLPAILDRLGGEGVLQLMVEGGAGVASAFHREGLVDRYVVYVAPALLGGDDGVGLFRGPGAPTMADVWRGSFRRVTQLGADVRLDLDPPRLP